MRALRAAVAAAAGGSSVLRQVRRSDRYLYSTAAGSVSCLPFYRGDFAGAASSRPWGGQPGQLDPEPPPLPSLPSVSAFLLSRGIPKTWPSEVGMACAPQTDGVPRPCCVCITSYRCGEPECGGKKSFRCCICMPEGWGRVCVTKSRRVVKREHHLNSSQNYLEDEH